MIFLWKTKNQCTCEWFKPLSGQQRPKQINKYDYHEGVIITVALPTYLNWLCFIKTDQNTGIGMYSKQTVLTSLSEVPQTEQHLHSMHCQRYFFTEMFIFGVNCRQVGWPIIEHNTNE